MNTLHPFERRVAKAWDPSDWRDLTIMVGVSGGADSVALLHALVTLRPDGPGRVIVAHFHHGLRAGEADDDLAFVRDLCHRCDVECHVGHATKPAETGGDGLEAQARQQRYQFLRQQADRTGARYLAMAHTADDQVETILHRVLRGTGLGGLAGIPRSRSLSELTTVIRPLLDVSRDDVIAYLADRQQTHRNDSSNASLRFTRNRIRHQLLPLLKREYNGRLDHALLRLGRQAREASELIDRLVQPLVEQTVRPLPNGRIELDCRPLQQQDSFLLCQLLITIWRRQAWPQGDMAESRWLELAELIQCDSRAGTELTLPGSVVAQRLTATVQLEVRSANLSPIDRRDSP